MPKILVKSKIRASESKKLYESKLNPSLEKIYNFILYRITALFQVRNLMKFVLTKEEI